MPAKENVDAATVNHFLQEFLLKLRQPLNTEYWDLTLVAHNELELSLVIALVEAILKLKEYVITTSLNGLAYQIFNSNVSR